MRVSLACTITLLLLSTFQPSSTTSPQVALTSNVTIGDTLCPGTVQFECSGIYLARLLWMFNEADEIERLGPTSEPGRYMPAEWQGVVIDLLSVEQFTNPIFANFSSTLTVDLAVLHMFAVQSVQCGELGNNQDHLDIPNFEIRAAPPPPDYSCIIGEESGNSVNLVLHWNSTASSNVDQFCVMGTCEAQRSEVCVAPGTPYSCSDIEAGRVHSFDVASVNCGNQYSNSNFMFEPGVPTQLMLCTSIPVYLKSTNHLDRIETLWNPIMTPLAAQNGPCTGQEVTEYVLMYENVEVLVTSELACTPEAQCSYSIMDNFRGSDRDYTVAVAGKNIVGRGAVTTCAPQSIRSINTVLDVITDTVAESPTIQCDFLTVLIGTTQCEVCYSVDPLCQDPTCLSVQPGAGGVAVIDLPPLQTGVHYCYIVTAVIGGVTAAKVEGIFSTACDIADLSCSRIRPSAMDQRCNGTEGAGSLPIVNGVVCYTGTTAGSTATYLCDAGYETVVGPNPRTCQRDGNWDSYTLICVPENMIQEANIGGAIGATFVLTFIGTIAIGAAIIITGFYLLWRYKILQKTITRAESIGEIYEEIPRHIREPPPTPKPRAKAATPPGEYEYPTIGSIQKNSNEYNLDVGKNVAYNPVKKT